MSLSQVNFVGGFQGQRPVSYQPGAQDCGLATSPRAKGPEYTSLGRSPRSRLAANPRAKGPAYTSLGRSPRCGLATNPRAEGPTYN